VEERKNSEKKDENIKGYASRKRGRKLKDKRKKRSRSRGRVRYGK